MAALFGKLQLKDQKELLLLHAPQEFQPHLSELAGKASWAAEAEAGKKSRCFVASWLSGAYRSEDYFLSTICLMIS